MEGITQKLIRRIAGPTIREDKARRRKLSFDDAVRLTIREALEDAATGDPKTPHGNHLGYAIRQRWERWQHQEKA